MVALVRAPVLKQDLLSDAKLDLRLYHLYQISKVGYNLE